MEFPWEGQQSSSSSTSGAFPWECGGPCPWSVDPAQEEEVSPAEAGIELFNLLVDLKHAGTIGAKHACLIAHWAHLAGACGPVCDLARKPTVQSGGFSRHFDRIVGTRLNESKDWYELAVPRWIRADGSRSASDMSCLVPHEELAREVNTTPDLPAKLEAAKRDGTLPRAFLENDL
eukprot:8358056-Alexandrium_andersonii.AAC.1